MGTKKLGRPTDNPKDIPVKLRVDKDTDNMLTICSEDMGISKSEVVRRGIKKMYDDLKK